MDKTTNEKQAEEILSRLTDEQKKVVKSESQITLVEALAGSGKTHTLIEYCKYKLLKEPQSNILYLVFNSDMAKGTNSKIKSLPQELAQRIKAQTIHSFAHQYLMNFFFNNLQTSSADFDYNHITRYFAECNNGNHNVGKSVWVKDILTQMGVDENFDVIYLVYRLFTLFTQSSFTPKEWEQEIFFYAGKIDEAQMGDDAHFEAKLNRACFLCIELVNKVISSIIPSILEYSKGNKTIFYLSHNIILKYFQIKIKEGIISIPSSFTHLLVDESQDLNEVMISIVTSNFFSRAKKVFVGDNQQKIYSFTGCVSALSKLYEKKKAENLPDEIISKLYLTTSFRCIPLVTQEATVFLNFLGFDKGMSSVAKLPENIETMGLTKVRIFRTNASILSYIIMNPDTKFIVKNFPKKELYNTFRDLILYFYGTDEQKETIRHPTLRIIQDKKELSEYLEKTNDVELSSKIKLLTRFSRKKNFNIMKFLKETVEEQIIDRAKGEDRYNYWELITAHKSKGLEWDYVDIADDFPTIYSTSGNKGKGNFKYYVAEKEILREEVNLFYVAVTRAKFFLHIPDEYSIKRDYAELKQKVRLID